MKSIICMRSRVDLDILPISTVPMARNTENPRFFKVVVVIRSILLFNNNNNTINNNTTTTATTNKNHKKNPEIHPRPNINAAFISRIINRKSNPGAEQQIYERERERERERARTRGQEERRGKREEKKQR